jgi:hypothetical protein
VAIMMVGILAVVAFLCLSNMILEIVGQRISKTSSAKSKNSPQEAARH